MKRFNQIQTTEDYIDFRGDDLVGDRDRGVYSCLTFDRDARNWYITIRDTGNDFTGDISDVPEETVKFMIGEDAFNQITNK